MNNQELNNGILEYKRLKEEKARCIQVRDRLKELELNSSVNEYVELARSLNILKEIRIDSDEDIIFKSFNLIAQNTNDSNHIYVLMGTYMQDKFGKEIRINTNTYLPNHLIYNLYFDLETMKQRKIGLSIVKKFEDENRIIKPSCCDYEECTTYYNNLRNNA